MGRALVPLALLALLACLQAASTQEVEVGAEGPAFRVRINELMAKNKKTTYDERMKTPDWIELQVTAADGSALPAGAVNLAGWGLTDDPASESIWQFPDRDLSLNGSLLLVFADGSDAEEDEGANGAPVHAGFKLSTEGKYLAVIAPGGSVTDELDPYPHQVEDVSWGRALGVGEGVYSYFLEPTPGWPNARPLQMDTPVLSKVTEKLEQAPSVTDDLAITACVGMLEKAGPLASFRRAQPWLDVKLVYRVNYNREYQVSMTPQSRNSTKCDEDSGFQEYEATLIHKAHYGPGGAGNGDMLRWMVRVTTGEGNSVRDPAFSALDAPQYYGTVVGAKRKSSGDMSDVDTLYWFIPNGDSWEIEKNVPIAGGVPTSPHHVARSSFYFQGKFYDNASVRQRGITALIWPKKKFKVDFKGSAFVAELEGGKKIKNEEINLQSHWEEPGEETYMRENVASDFFDELGVPTAAALHVELKQNGRFYGLYSIVEQIDEDFLERQGQNPEGHLYKAFAGTASNLNSRVPERLLKKVYRRGNDADDDEDWSDLYSLTQALAGKDARYKSVEQYLYTHVDLAEAVNELAAQAAILNQDRCTKNYYMFYDTAREEWSRFPWDMEAAMGISSALGGFPAPDYCMLVCDQFNSPLYCDSEHPQDPLPEPLLGPRSAMRRTVVPGLETPELNFNHFTDAMLDTPSVREMYLRRLRTIVDEYIATDYLGRQVRHYHAKVKRAAAADEAKWGTGDIEEGVKQLEVEQLPKRRDQLIKKYGPGGDEPLLPAQQPADAKVDIPKVYISAAGSKQLSSVQVQNPNGFALDVSGWIVTSGENVTEVRLLPISEPFCSDVEPKRGFSCAQIAKWGTCGEDNVVKKKVCRSTCGYCTHREGPLRYTFKPGTVIPGGKSIFVTDNVHEYKQYLMKYGQSRHVVGPLEGDTGADVAALRVFNRAGQVVGDKEL